MRYRGLSWKQILGNALLLAGGLALGAWYHAESMARRANDAALEQLARDSVVWAGLIGGESQAEGFAAKLESIVGRSGRAAVFSAEAGLIAARGAGTVEDVSQQPELQRCLSTGAPAAAIRYMGGVEHLVAAAPISAGEKNSRVALWIARPSWSWRDSPAAVLEIALLVTAVATCLSLLLAVMAARSWRRPLRRIAEHAAHMARTPNAAPSEIGADDLTGLARSLEDMRSNWSSQFESIQRQRVTLEALLAQIQEGVVASRADGKLVLINPAAVRLLQLDSDGLPIKEFCKRLVGKAVERCIPQHDVLELLQAARSAEVEGSRVERPAVEARLQVDTADGVLHVLARGADLLLPSAPDARESAAEGRVVVLTDISEIIRTGQVRSDFVANASHELRTPLSTIRASVEALTSIDLATEHDAAQRFIGVIDRQSARLAAMVSDLLDLARLESAAAAYKSQELHWDEIADELRERFAGRLESKSLRLTVNLPEHAEDGVFSAPPYLVTLVLDNLVDNAIKFTPAQGSIRVRFERLAEQVRIDVEDSGCGIPPEDQERVFERFYQVERARSGPDRGTGLGLSIVKRAVLALGGTVELSSELGKGTRFSISLPVGS